MNNAFVHGDLIEEVYIDMALGYEPKFAIQGEKMVCKIFTFPHFTWLSTVEGRLLPIRKRLRY